MAKRIFYVIGNLLIIPMRKLLAVHVLTEEKEANTQMLQKNEQTANPKQKKLLRTQQGVKRTCGAAQKSVRIKKKNSIQKKD